MNRIASVFGLCLVILGISAGLFDVKYRMMSLESEYKSVRKKITATEESIRILQAEWAYLNDPRRLQAMAQSHLGLKKGQHIALVSFEQYVNLENYRRRPHDRVVTVSTTTTTTPAKVLGQHKKAQDPTDDIDKLVSDLEKKDAD